jgi:hypothetical protein
MSGSMHFLWRDSAWAFHSRENALQFLARFRDDPAAMSELRQILSTARLHHDTVRMNDQQVMEHIAGLLVRGELLLAAEWRSALAAGHAGQPGPSAPAASAQRSTAPPRSSRTQDAPTWRRGGGQQAAVLTSAADTGAPLCDI